MESSDHPVESGDRHGTAERASRRRHAYFHPEVVVALEHIDHVVRTLTTVGVAHTVVDRSADLGLALLRLGDDATAARDMAAATGADGSAVAADPPEFDTDMDRFLWSLRAWFRVRYAGWTPTMGKNRLVGHVVGGGHISHSGGGDPHPSDWRPGLRVARPGLGARVGVLDTSVFPHEWLGERWIGARDDVLAEASAYPAIAGHGTFVTGLVLRLAPGCEVEVRRVLDREGQAESWTVAKEIVELGRRGIDVLNLSMVCYTEDGQPPLALAAAVDRLDPEIVVVAAAGNHGLLTSPKEEGHKPAWPAALDDVIAVGAADGVGTRAAFTPADAPWIDVLSNGVEVASTFVRGRVDAALTSQGAQFTDFDGYAEWSGSSFAAALVSGAIAARTVPGRTSARAAWEQLRTEHAPVETPGRKGPSTEHLPWFLPLLDADRATGSA